MIYNLQMIYNKYAIIGILIASIESDLMILTAEQRCEFRKRIAMMEVNKFNKMVADRIGEYTELRKGYYPKKIIMKTRQQLREELDQLIAIFEVLKVDLDNISSFEYYAIYGTRNARAHNIEVQNKKALSYWKRRYNRILTKLKF